MKSRVIITELLDGAKEARGTAVIIDVFRAFSVECYLFARGVRRVLAVGDLETAYELKRMHPDALLVGERKGYPLPGFDCGNSPTQLGKMDLFGKTVIHTTSAGTQGIAAAAHTADEVITGSLVNARAVAEYLRFTQPADITLVCMGLRGSMSAQEDVLCAQYIASMLRDCAYSETELKQRTEALRQGAGKRFFDPAKQDIMPESDFSLCTKPDIFPFVIRANAADGYFEMQEQQIVNT